MTVTSIRQPVSRAVDCEGRQHAEILEKTGITYRQLDYWTRSGRIECHYHVHGKIVTKGGSGSTACWPLDQVAIVGRVAALLRRSFGLEHAFELATNLGAASAALAELTYIQADLIEQADREDERVLT